MQPPQLLKQNLMLNGMGIAVTAGLVSMAVVLMVLPLDRQQANLQSQILEMQNLQGEQAEVQELNRKLQAQVDEKTARWNELLRRIPPEAHVSEFLAQLTELAEVHSLSVNVFNPGLSYPRALFTEMDVDLQAAGDYVSICGFLRGLHQMPRICNISKLEINASTQSTGEYTVSLSMRILYQFDDSPDESVPPST